MAATTYPSNSSKNSKKRKNRTNKGGGGGKSSDQEDYYQRLLYSAGKILRKQSKLVRNLESQKLVRKIKERREKSSDENSNRTNDNNGNGIEGTYQQLKHLDLEYVVQECLRRLGILHLDPKLAKSVEEVDDDEEDDIADDDDDDDDDAQQEETDPSNAAKEESSNATSSIGREDPPTKKEKELVEKILKHKKMQSTLEEWNDKVTEYRRWTLHQQERLLGFMNNTQSSYTAESCKKKKNKKRKLSGSRESGANKTAKFNNTSTNDKILENNATKSLFVCLGDENDHHHDGGGVDDYENDDTIMPHYGPGSFPEEKKKNRMGQRQRKAKQMAIEAKKAGRVHRAADSVNWRKKKKQPINTTPTATTQEEGTRQYKHKGGRSSEKTVTRNEEQLHPSWAAAQKKKESSGIVEFQGKKITF